MKGSIYMASFGSLTILEHANGRPISHHGSCRLLPYGDVVFGPPAFITTSDLESKILGHS